MTTANYIDHRMSTRVTSSFVRKVVGKTDITTLASGRERRNAAWAFKKMQYTASYAMLNDMQRDEVLSAFYACNGQLYAFRFNDAGDRTVTKSPFDTSTLVGTEHPAQLTKRYQFGSMWADRVIQAVSACTVYDNTGAVFAGTFDRDLGLFTPAANWGVGIQYTWTGTFDVWVRFNTDELDVTMQTLDVATTDIELIECLVYNSGS